MTLCCISLDPSGLSPQIHIGGIYSSDVIITCKPDKCSQMILVSSNMATSEGVDVTKSPRAVQEAWIPQRQEVATRIQQLPNTDPLGGSHRPT